MPSSSSPLAGPREWMTSDPSSPTSCVAGRCRAVAGRRGRASLRAVRRRLADHRAHPPAGRGLHERLAAAGHAAAGVRRHAQLASIHRPTRWRRCRERASAERLGSSWRRRRATRAASSIARTCATRGVALREDGEADIDVTYVAGWFDAPRLHRGQRRSRSTGARRACQSRCGTAPRLIFTAHSIPLVDGRAIAVSRATLAVVATCR